jgi:hypothetical protein
MSQKPSTPKIEPLSLTVTDLTNLMNMAEASLKAAEFCHHLFGNNDVVQQRAIASDLQARFEREIVRQGLIAEERERLRVEKLEQEKRDKADAKRKEEEAAKTNSAKTGKEANSVPEVELETESG